MVVWLLWRGPNIRPTFNWLLRERWLPYNTTGCSVDLDRSVKCDSACTMWHHPVYWVLLVMRRAFLDGQHEISPSSRYKWRLEQFSAPTTQVRTVCCVQVNMFYSVLTRHRAPTLSSVALWSQGKPFVFICVPELGIWAEVATMCCMEICSPDSYDNLG